MYITISTIIYFYHYTYTIPTSMGGLGYGNLALSSIASSIASIYESRVELSSLVNLGLVSKKTLKKFDRCRSSLAKV